MNIAYKRINKAGGSYSVLLDEKNVGSIIGKPKDWKLNNLFGASVSNGITRDLAVKNALENLWAYELEFELFHNPENNQEENLETEEDFVDASEDTEENDSQVSPSASFTLDRLNTSFLNTDKEEVDEAIEAIEENDLTESESKLCDDYQPMEKEPISSKCDRIVKNFLVKIKEYANKIGIY